MIKSRILIVCCLVYVFVGPVSMSCVCLSVYLCNYVSFVCLCDDKELKRERERECGIVLRTNFLIQSGFWRTFFSLTEKIISLNKLTSFRGQFHQPSMQRFCVRISQKHKKTDNFFSLFFAFDICEHKSCS